MTQELVPILNRILQEGYQLSPDAFTHLQELSVEEAANVVKMALSKAASQPQLFIIDQEFLVNLKEEPPRDKPVTPRELKPLASRAAARIEVDPLEPARPSGDVNGFIDYFNSRFVQLEGILKQRVDVRDAIPLSQALKLPVKTKFKAIGIVSRKSSRNNRLYLDLEDPESNATVMVTGEEALKKGLEILNDQIICIDGVKFRDDLLIANDLIWPDVPMHDIKRADEPVCALFIGDVHIGSKYFRADLFDKFIKWMNMELGPSASRELASRVKYLIIVGDLVDGIGIYPEQLDELTITTLNGQYEESAKLLSKLPDYVEIIIIPGNHDAVRRSLPQPVIPESYAPSLYANPRVHMLPNPVSLRLHGVQVQLAHGTALNDILGSTPGHAFSNPVKGMELLLRCRHVAPIYGQSTPIAPEKTDRLVIRKVPDILAMGHIHIHDKQKYKGVTILSLGSFQDQTPFQKRMKLEPTPGVISVFNLANHQHIPLDLERLN
ncbi:MAG: DNA-directed DNA polymerase II small subunit [Candidatus Bathyarchaeota archaeon]|nr:DNA-directed DNA polymerase II small subunit [Candidatus Bathyarchaeota archaeon]